VTDALTFLDGDEGCDEINYRAVWSEQLIQDLEASGAINEANFLEA
jgi:hypothetical protein